MVTASEMSTSEAARVLGVASETLRAWVKQGKVPARQSPLGLLFDASAVHRFAADRERARREGSIRTQGAALTPHKELDP